MKKFTLLIIALFIFTGAFSQNADNKWAIGSGAWDFQ